MTARDRLLALLSEGYAPGRPGASREKIDCALRAAGLSTQGVGAELAAMVDEQRFHPERLGLVVCQGGDWWATVLGHRAGKRVPLAPKTRETLRAAMRATEVP